MDIQNLRYILARENMTKVARETGIHINTLFRIRDGINDNPRYKTIHALSEYFKVGK